MLVGGICCGFMLAVYMANAGGAWDNAKECLWGESAAASCSRYTWQMLVVLGTMRRNACGGNLLRLHARGIHGKCWWCLGQCEGMLVGGICCGFMLAVYMANAGGAW